MHPARPATGVLWMLLTLVGVATGVSAFTCPTLPAGTNLTTIALTAATYPGWKYQTLAYNGSKWGPQLRLTLGQLYQFDVTNADIPEGTAVHWHGQHLFNSSWADGVEGLTQAAIPAGATFSYRFRAGPAGTHWYHSHAMAQFGDGLRGPLIVEDPADPSAGLYDEDTHLLLLADVFATRERQQLEALQQASMGGLMSLMTMCPTQDVSDAPWGAVEVNGESFDTTGKAAVFKVQQSKRYRFRAIAGMSSWALRVSVSDHNLTLIAVDGQPIQPKNISSLLLGSGERADFVLHADQSVGNYWISVTTLNGHNSPAILSYEGDPDPATDPAVASTAYVKNMGCPDANATSQEDQGGSSSMALQAHPSVEPPPQESTKQFTLLLANAGMDSMPSWFPAAASQPNNPFGLTAAAAAALPANGTGCPEGQGSYCWSINWNVFEAPAVLPIYSAAVAADSAGGGGSDASGSGGSDSGSELSPPASSVPRDYGLSLEQGDVVDLAIINLSNMAHPMHLHGASFWVLAISNGQAVNDSGHVVNSVAATYNLRNPVLRDTINVPPATATDATDAMPGMDGMGGMGGMKKLRSMDGKDQGTMGSSGMAGMETSNNTSPGSTPADSSSSDAAVNGASNSTGMPSGEGSGYVIVRFRAHNPGVWAFHCHVDLHASSGMVLYFVVKPPSGAAGTASTNGTAGSGSAPWDAPQNLECDANVGAPGGASPAPTLPVARSQGPVPAPSQAPAPSPALPPSPSMGGV